MTSNVATRTKGEIARPLRVLVPLIKADFEEAEASTSGNAVLPRGR